MKLCLISPFPPPYGGMAVQAQKMARNLSCDGHEVLTVRTNQINNENSRIISRIPGLRTIYNLFMFLYNLNNALKKCDAVYFLTGFFNFFFWVTLPGLLIIFFHRKPVILSARGGNARLFLKKNKKLVAPILKKVNIITTPSGFLQSAFKDTLGLHPIIVPNILDLEQFEFSFREKFSPRLMVTRNLEPIYDLGCVIKAFQHIAEIYPNANLDIFGDGSERHNLERLAIKLSLQKNVTFFGQVSHEHIQKLYKEHDIYINASQVDNLPGVILEAFACGLPVVSTNAGGIPYIVEHEKNGLLSPVGDHIALSKNILRIIENPECGQALASAGKKELQKYSWKHIGPLLNNCFCLLEKNEQSKCLSNRRH